MEPKTKLQKQVVGLSSKLPALSDNQSAWAIKKCFEMEGFHRAKKIWCTECGEVFEAKESDLSYSLLGANCPCCGKHLKVQGSRKRVYSPQSMYFTIITTIRGFQVLRHFVARKSCRVGQPAKFELHEAVQNWISPKGIEIIMARLTNCSYGAYDQWCWSTSMEIRSDYYVKDKYHIWARDIKTLRLLPKLKYAGIDNNYHGITPDILFRMLLRYPFVETLIKQGDKELLEYMENNITQVGKYWPSIKIARRHGLKIDKRTDLRMYFDYLEMSDAIGRDVRSPKYLCPKNLKKAHDEVMKLKQKLDDKIDFEKKMKQALKDEAVYRKQKGKFFGIAFTDGTIQVRVLESVLEFLEEGTTMHHCVHTNKYYLKPESLILSARIGDKRIETVEVNLKTLSVVQSRGVCNQNTEYHERIIGLVKKNINLIRRKLTA